jgi:hypothetical protein
MKHCPIRGIACNGLDCAWYLRGNSHNIDDCVILAIARALQSIKDHGIIAYPSA